MQEQKLETLFQRFIGRIATEAEKQEFFELIRLPGSDLLLKELAERYPVPDDVIVELPSQASNEILAAILGSEDSTSASKTPATPARRVYFPHRRWWAAAAILILAVSGVIFLKSRKRSVEDISLVQQDVKAPVTNKATITLPNGQRIMLDTIPNGTLIAGIARKTADGRLVFEGSTAEVSYIVTTNPRNSKAMQITLPDHTEVWLNADTYMQYPSDYNVKDRLITLKGEAYFEVRHNAEKPFKVSAGEQTIEDVGTSFNVKAYPDEAAVQTTLLEGVVKINHTVSLKPGQQYSDDKITNANTEEVMAWKNGSFYLDGRELGAVANELGRWYDVEIVFNNPETRHSIVFGGEMGRSLTLLKAIDVLKELKVSCRLEGKKLIVE